MLQQIRTRFTSGRPRILPQEKPGPMLAVQVADNERSRIREFIEENGKVEDFKIAVSVVTTMPNDAESLRAHTWRVDEGMYDIVRLADKLIKVEGLACVGLVVRVWDTKAETELQYTRPFTPEPKDAERLAYAALKAKFTKAKKGKFDA